MEQKQFFNPKNRKFTLLEKTGGTRSGWKITAVQDFPFEGVTDVSKTDKKPKEKIEKKDETQGWFF